MKKVVYVVFLIISISLLLHMVALIFFTNKIDKQTEGTTVLYSATVSDVFVDTEEKNVEIETEDYNTRLYISENVCKYIDIDDVRNIEKGQDITFRIEKTKVKQVNNVSFIDIVTLETDECQIISLEEYNRCVRFAARPARITMMVISLLSLLVFCFCCFELIKSKR